MHSEQRGKSRSLRAAALVMGVLVMGMGSVHAEGGWAKHKRIFAVPTPGKIVIDGKLDDWDRSGELYMFVQSETADMQSAKFALMYDAEALYIGAEVRDPSPMMNRHDPKVDASTAWDADAAHVRICFDPKLAYPIEMGHGPDGLNRSNPGFMSLTLWYYTDTQTPCLQMGSTMQFKPPRPEWGPCGVVPGELFAAKYLKMPDGRGYSFEYRIPWSTFGVATPPKAGDLRAGTAQVHFGQADGMKINNGVAGVVYDIMSGPGFPYQHAGCWGKILFAAKGSLSKELVEEGLPPEKPLPLTFSYEMPEDGDASICLFDAQGGVARILIAQAARLAGKNTERWDGLDSDGKPLTPGDYSWKGVWHKGLTTKFIMSVHNSGQPPHKTDDNTGGWGGDHGTSEAACAVEGGMLLGWNACENGWGVIKTDLKGKKQWGSKASAIHLATDGQRFFAQGGYGYDMDAGVRVYDVKDARRQVFGNGDKALAAPPGGDKESDVVSGLACHGGVLYVAYAKRNLIAVHDAAQGTLKTTWPVPAPGRLAVRPDGSLAVISAGSVVSIRDGKPITDHPITDHLDIPSGIAVAPDGTLYVSNGGKLQNVSVFGADGTYLRSIGKTGGRPRVGLYDKTGMLEPGGMAVAGDGRLWVAETLDSPKRQSVWDVQTGACASEFFGGTAYFGWAWMDPKHADEIYCHNVLWKVDLDKGTWRPHSTIWRATTPNMIRASTPDGYAGHFRVMTAQNGKQFGWGMTDYSGMLYMREGDIFKPIAGNIRVAFGQFGSGLLYPVMKEFHEKNKAGAYLWQDQNNDQTIQPEELMVSPAGRGETVFNWIDPDLNVWCDAGWIYRPARFAADGRPIYDFTKSDPIPFKGANANATSLYLDDEGSIYTLSGGSFARWTRDWKPVWAYNGIVQWDKALGLPLVRPGLLHGLTMPLGVAGDFTGAVTYFNPYHLFTRDGIYVGMVTRDSRDGKGMGADVIATESIQGQLVKPDGMNRYFLLAGDQDGRVTEIVGLDKVMRLAGGTYAHTAAQAQTVADARKKYETALAHGQHFALVRGKGGLAAATAVGKRTDDQRGFEVRGAYDDQNLYLAFDLSAPAPLVNAAPSAQTLFKGGNCLDIQLATDPAADPKRKAPAPGDVRLLVTQQLAADGTTLKPLAVLFQPKVKGFGGAPTVLSSSTGKESFDRIATTDRVALEVKPAAGRFSAVVTIPLDVLGLALRPGVTVKMDVGYLYGNATGTQVAMRAYWRNNGFAANVTYDVPNESRLEPAEWGNVEVE